MGSDHVGTDTGNVGDAGSPESLLLVVSLSPALPGVRSANIRPAGPPHGAVLWFHCPEEATDLSLDETPVSPHSSRPADPVHEPMLLCPDGS